MKFTKIRINRFLPSKRYFTSQYNGSYDFKYGHQAFGGYAIRIKGTKLSGYDHSLRDAVPEWVYHNDYEFEAGDLISEWIDGRINRKDVVDGIQAGLNNPPDEDEE